MSSPGLAWQLYSCPRMIDQVVYINLEWREEGPEDVATGEHLVKQVRKVCTSTEYPRRLPCSNPHCENGGFEIGEKIEALLVSDVDSEQNSLVCINAMHEDRANRCLHTILYSLICIFPHPKETKRRKSF